MSHDVHTWLSRLKTNPRNGNVTKDMHTYKLTYAYIHAHTLKHGMQCYKEKPTIPCNMHEVQCVRIFILGIQNNLRLH